MDAALVRKVIESALQNEDYDSSTSKDVAFHMTDWADDFIRLRQFIDDPTSFSPEQVEDSLMAFLVHVPNHLAAASKLMLDIPVTDVFGVGSTEESLDGEEAT